MRYLAGVLATAVVALLIGCATPSQMMVNLKQDALQPKARLGVVMTALPKVDTSFPGANCLLCIAAANANHVALTSHTQTLPQEDISDLKNQIAAAIRKKGVDVVVIDEPLKLDDLADNPGAGMDIAVKDHTPLKAKYKVDKLLVIDILALGITRPYSAYVPTGDPRSVLEGRGYIVDLANNRYQWFHKVRVTRTAQGPWDEPPKFPGLTNAYFQVIEMGKDDFVKPFVR